MTLVPNSISALGTCRRWIISEERGVSPRVTHSRPSQLRYFMRRSHRARRSQDVWRIGGGFQEPTPRASRDRRRDPKNDEAGAVSRLHATRRQEGRHRQSFEQAAGGQAPHLCSLACWQGCKKRRRGFRVHKWRTVPPSTVRRERESIDQRPHRGLFISRLQCKRRRRKIMPRVSSPPGTTH